METKKINLTVFWIGALYMILMGWVASWDFSATYRNSTLTQISQTIWAEGSVLFWLYVLSIPLGAILAAVGILIFLQEKRTRVLVFGIGVFLTISVVQLLPKSTHYPPIFGIGGGLILASFLGILWFWAKNRKPLEGLAKTAADYQLVSYVFFFTAMWYLCGELGGQFFKAFEGESPGSPVSIIIFLSLGWIFLFLSHYKVAQAKV